MYIHTPRLNIILLRTAWRVSTDSDFVTSGLCPVVPEPHGKEDTYVHVIEFQASAAVARGRLSHGKEHVTLRKTRWQSYHAAGYARCSNYAPPTPV